MGWLLPGLNGVSWESKRLSEVYDNLVVVRIRRSILAFALGNG